MTVIPYATTLFPLQVSSEATRYLCLLKSPNVTKLMESLSRETILFNFSLERFNLASYAYLKEFYPLMKTSLKSSSLSFKIAVPGISIVFPSFFNNFVWLKNLVNHT